MTAMNRVRMTARDGLDGYLVTGPASAASLADAALPAPAEPMGAQMQEGALVARTGRDEFMAFVPKDRAAPQGDWCFRRFDRVFALDGDWIALMAQLCQFDFRKLAQGGWMMSAVAGVGCWLYRDGETLLIGCDPGYAAYLADTIETLVKDLGTAYPTGGAS